MVSVEFADEYIDQVDFKNTLENKYTLKSFLHHNSELKHMLASTKV